MVLVVVNANTGGIMDLDHQMGLRQSQNALSISNEDHTAKLTSRKDTDSRKVLLKEAEIREFKPILDVAKMLSEDTLPTMSYHKKCCSLFTMQKDLDKITAKQGSAESRPSLLQAEKPPQEISFSLTDEEIFIFCEKKSKYQKGSIIREPLTKYTELRSDETIRDAAVEKQDSRIPPTVSRDLVAKEGHHHRSCYKDYARRMQPSSRREIAEYRVLKSHAEFIWESVQLHQRGYDGGTGVRKLIDLMSMLTHWMKDVGMQKSGIPQRNIFTENWKQYLVRVYIFSG